MNPYILFGTFMSLFLSFFSFGNYYSSYTSLKYIVLLSSLWTLLSQLIEIPPHPPAPNPNLYVFFCVVTLQVDKLYLRLVWGQRMKLIVSRGRASPLPALWSVAWWPRGLGDHLCHLAFACDSWSSRAVQTATKVTSAGGPFVSDLCKGPPGP